MPKDDLDDLLDLIGEDDSADTPTAAPADDVDDLLSEIEAPAAEEEFEEEVLDEIAVEPTPALEPVKRTRAPRATKKVEEAKEPEISPEEQAQIDALQAELSAPAPEKKAVRRVRPKPESQLTPAEKKIRDLQDQLARKKAQEIENAADAFDKVLDEDEVVVIHIVEDGFTFGGRVWYRGQEIQFPVDGEAYEQTLDRNGDSWLDNGDYEQVALWGSVKFRKGPWPGKQADQVSPEERRRANAAPVI